MTDRNVYYQRKQQYYASHRYNTGHHRWTLREIEKVMFPTKPDAGLARELGVTLAALHTMRCRCKDRSVAYD